MPDSENQEQDRDALFDNILKNLDEKRERTLNEHKNSRILVVDGMNTFLRGFAVNPTLNPEGEHIGGIVAFLNSLGAAIRRFEPTRCIVAFDGKGGSKRRKQIYSGYKSGRSTKDGKRKSYNRSYEFSQDTAQEDMRREIGRLALYLEALPVTTMMIDHVEADDVIAYVSSELYDGEDSEVIIMSTDKDFLQLVDGRVTLYRPTKKIEYTPEDVVEEYGVHPRHFVAYRAVLGDASDNIPGIDHVGDKRFRDKLGPLLESEDSVTPEDIVEFAREREDESATYGRIAEAYDVLERNFKLMDLGMGNISATKKKEVRDICRTDRSAIDRLQFQELYMEDKLWAGIKNFQSFLNERFLKLDRYGQDED
jgi:5'-3' exonuclease